MGAAKEILTKNLLHLRCPKYSTRAHAAAKRPGTVLDKFIPSPHTSLFSVCGNSTSMYLHPGTFEIIIKSNYGSSITHPFFTHRLSTQVPISCASVRPNSLRILRDVRYLEISIYGNGMDTTDNTTIELTRLQISANHIPLIAEFGHRNSYKNVNGRGDTTGNT